MKWNRQLGTSKKQQGIATLPRPNRAKVAKIKTLKRKKGHRPRGFSVILRYRIEWLEVERINDDTGMFYREFVPQKKLLERKYSTR